MEETKDKRVTTVLKEYQALKYLSAKINAIVEPIILTFLLEGILFYSVGLKPLILLNSTGISVAVLLVSFFACFYVATDACDKVILQKMA
jgi:uncharacterized membrane protein YiaA